MDDVTFGKLERLGRLRSSGVLSDQEFEAKKVALLDDKPSNSDTTQLDWSAIKRRQKWPWVVLATFLFWPIGLYFMWTRPTYAKRRGEPRLVAVWEKTITSVVFVGIQIYWMSRIR